METALKSRQIALDILIQVMDKKQNLDAVFDKLTGSIDGRDKAFIRMLVTTTLRRLGQIDDALGQLMSSALPTKARIVQNILRLGACQILFMQTAQHAAVSTSVELARLVGQDFYTKLINGVLRNLIRQKESLLVNQNAARLNTPTWIWDSWVNAYGCDNAARISEANLTEASTFLSVKKDAQMWAEKVAGTVNDTGSIELPDTAYIPDLSGFSEGAWWVQDAAAALPVLLFDDLKDKYVADFCAAPGGKTAGLIARGAKVDAYDISEKRMMRVQENLKRLQMHANLKTMDANDVPGADIYDAILIDAPCSATGTIRRHPDLYFHRTPEDIQKLNTAQKKLLQTAHRLIKKEGQVVYCTCSLQPEEGEAMIESVHTLFDVMPIKNPELAAFATKKGFIRTFPYQNKDGFFMALLKKR